MKYGIKLIIIGLVAFLVMIPFLLFYPTSFWGGVFNNLIMGWSSVINAFIPENYLFILWTLSMTLVVINPFILILSGIFLLNNNTKTAKKILMATSITTILLGIPSLFEEDVGSSMMIGLILPVLLFVYGFNLADKQ